MKCEQNRKVFARNYLPDGQLKSIVEVVEHKNSSYYVYIPRYVLYMIILYAIAIAIALITGLVVIVPAPRPGLYQESCVRRSCMKTLNLKCLNNSCLCEKNYFYINKCVPKKTYTEKCHMNYYCIDNKNLVCLDGSCKCTPTRFWDGSMCTNKGTLAETCQSDEQCLTDSMLYCNKNTKKCECDSTRFWDGYACFLKRTLNEHCNNDLECMDWKKLTCINGTCQCNSLKFWDIAYSMCRDKFAENVACTQTLECLNPMNCTSLNICQCGVTEYYDSSYLTCMPKKTLGGMCLSTHNCRADKYLECRSGTCQCIAAYPVWSNGTCRSYYSYDEGTCLNDNECKGILVCRHSTAASCNCPTNIQINKCDCPIPVNGSEYYWNSTECVLASSYSHSCVGNYSCKTIQENTACISGTCRCTGTEIWINGKCGNCGNGWTLYGNKCYKFTDNTVSQNTLGPVSAAIQTACNETSAKLAILNTTLINLFTGTLNPAANIYWVDGYSFSGVYKSNDATWIYTPDLCSTGSGSCLVVRKLAPNYCVQKEDCSQTHKVACEYNP